MNFLAHCLIGEQSAARAELTRALVAGSFLGDFVKGRVPESMPDALALGVRLHRRVDAYSNQHPVIRRSADRFPPELRRIAPILVDILCDHLLSRCWDDYHPDHLSRFTRRIYLDVAHHDDWLPSHGRRFLNYARERDLFGSYADWTVTEGAMRSITRRLNLSGLDPLIASSIPPLLDDLQADFGRYFPDILAHAMAWAAGEQPSVRPPARSPHG